MATRRSGSADGEAREADAPQAIDETRVDSRAVSAALTAADRDAVQPGARIGRYMVLEIVGSGAIGIVYAAYDPDLDRKVGLKLLRRSKSVGAPDAVNQRRGRLRREALALARLSHPNVVPVYEVGTFEDQIYVVMEFVEGSTLGEWLRAAERSWADIVGLFVQAGRGLAAAHRADIVHRDFKPENVRVGTDGRVRVLDFGLAGLARGSSEEQPAQDASDDDLSTVLSDEVAVTREGQIMGTPAYMAPEQAAGGHVDARSDQFSFCVALFEAIYGERPFRGHYRDPDRYRELGRARTLPGRRPPDLPGEIERVIVRGLSLDPDKRFASMDALLTELAAVAEGPRRLWWVPVSILLLALISVVAFRGRDEDGSTSCDGGEGMLDGVWDRPIAAELRAATLASRKPYADETWATVERTLDAWAERWRRARLRACESTHVYADQSTQTLERRFACLDRQLIRVESMLSALRRLERRPDELLERLTPMLGRIPSPEACAAANMFERERLVPSDEAEAREAEAIREQLAAIEGLTVVGEYPLAVERGRQALARARALEFEPVTAEALLILGLALDEQGLAREEVSELLPEAAWTAARSGNERALVRAAAAVAGNIGRVQADLALAEFWSELARAAFVRLGDDPEIEIELRTNLGNLAMIRGDFQAALDEHGRARELARERGEGHPHHLGAMMSIGDALRELGRYDDAAATIEGARLIAATELGAEHPLVPELLDVLGNVEASRGRFPEALALHERSLAILAEIHGEQHRSVAKTLNNMAIIYDETGRYEDSVATLERARKILVELAGADHPDVAFVDVNLGSALHNLERDEAAIERYEAALSVLEDSLGSEHMAVGVTLQNLGSARAALDRHEAALADFDRSEQILALSFDAQHPSIAAGEFVRGKSLAKLGRHDEALAAFNRALAIREQVYGPDHAELVEVLAGLARTELALGHPQRARELGERALSIPGDANTPSEQAEAKLALAVALSGDPRASAADRARARELGRAALRLLDAAEGGKRLRGQVADWLRSQGEIVDAAAGPG